MEFGKKLIYLREKRGLSQEELADELQVSRQTISNWENDEVSVDVEKAAEICRFFGVDMNYLFMYASNSCELAESTFSPKNANPEDKVARSQSVTGIWRSSIIISAILLAIFATFEIVICALHFGSSSANTSYSPLSRLFFLGAVVFGGLAISMSVVMLIVSIVMYRKYRQNEALNEDSSSDADKSEQGD